MLVLLVLAATIDAVVAAAEDVPAGGLPSTPASDVNLEVAVGRHGLASLPTSATTAFSHGPAPEAQALGAAPRLQDGSVNQDDSLQDDSLQDDDDEEYEDDDTDEYEYGEEEDEDSYEDPDEFEYEDGEGDGDEEESSGLRDAEYEEEDYGEDDDDEREGAGDGEVQPKERTPEPAEVKAADAEEKVIQDAVVRERRAEVRSLSDLPLSKLLRVQTELRRLTGHSVPKDQCDGQKKQDGPSRRWNPGAAVVERGPPAPTSPNAQPLNWGAATSPTAGRRKGTPTSTQSPVRRRGGGVGDRGGGDRGGGWASHEDWEEEVHEEEEDEGGWISWNKGHKKKGKGDIGSIFHISVTFLAFLAFGGYLLCLIMQAVKGNGYYNYPAAQGALRPAPNVMMVMMPNRAVTRRPGRPTGTTAGRKKRDATDQPANGPQPSSWRDWVPSFGEEDMRLLPEMDVDRMHRALLVVAEGYASFYHKKYTSVQP